MRTLLQRLIASIIILPLCIIPTQNAYAINTPCADHCVTNDHGTTIISPPTTNYASTIPANTSAFTTEEIVDMLISNSKLMIDVLYHISPQNRYLSARQVYPALTELETREDACIILQNRLQIATSQSQNSELGFVTVDFLQFLLSQNPFSPPNTSIQNAASPYAYGDFTIANEFGYISQGYTHTYGQNPVEIWSALTDFEALEKQSLTYVTARDYMITIYGQATSAYNCHSYAWYSQSTDNPYCIFSAEEYVNDPHIIKLSGSQASDVQVGDYICYRGINSISHSAVVVEISGNTVYVVSKWGANGLFKHPIATVPDSYRCEGMILCDAYRLSAHSFTNYVSRTTSTHTMRCNTCSKTITEAHSYNVLKKCKVCGYTSSGQTTID